MDGSGHVTVASNRLPISLTHDGDGEWYARPSVGGLVNALRPVLEKRGGTWVGWCGACDVAPPQVHECLEALRHGFELEPVTLTAREREGYYLGFSNRMLWPFLHALPAFAEPRAGDWSMYQRVNAAFAYVLASRGDGPIWVHDYHLMLAAHELRRLGCQRPIGFFLHTPFPEPEVILALPGRDTLVRAILMFDSIGFQTDRDRRNFLETVKELKRGTPGWKPSGSPLQPVESRARAFPISIDASSWSRRAADQRIARRAAEIRRDLGVERLLLGVDRLDYTKGLSCKLRGFARALELYPSLRGKVVLRQLAVPSREEIPAYARVRREVEACVDGVNARFGTVDWTPVDYVRGTWAPDELTAQYRAADVALVTPLRDGMNLVAKEFCACKREKPGVLVLSRFAGSALQLREGAIMVDPEEPDEVARAIQYALAMPSEEQGSRMATLQGVIWSEDIHAWAREPLEALTETPRRRILPVPRSATGTGRRVPARPTEQTQATLGA
jgi:trehalose 6-phosphate synthase